ALLLREFVELLAVAVLERVAGFAAAAASLLRLLDETAPRALRQVRDSPLLRRHLLRLLHVALRRLDLLPACHAGITSLSARTLTTPRLLLRQWRDEDAEPFATMSADPEVMRF